MFCTECGVQLDALGNCSVCGAKPAAPLATETLISPQQVSETVYAPSPPSNPGYGNPPSNPGYGAPQSNPGYGNSPSNPGYGGPQSNPGYGAPQSNPGYGAPQSNPGYGAPQSHPGYVPPPNNPPLSSSPATSAVFGGQPEPGMGPQVGAKVKEAGIDATKAFKTFATNPVGGLPAAYESLGPSRALGVGIVFAVVSLVCVFIGIYAGMDTYSRPEVGDSIKFFIFGTVPFLSLFGASAATRKLFGGQGSPQGDCFIAGATLLPLGFLMLVIGILGLVSIDVIGVLSLFALCFTILILYTGVTRISMVTESRATFAVPVMIVIALGLTKFIFGAVLPSFLPGAR